MAVGAQVEGAAGHVVPGPQRIVAEDEEGAVDGELEVGLRAGPAGESDDGRRVVVAGDEVFGAVQAGQEGAGGVLADGEVAEVVDRVYRRDDLVPVTGDGVVHGGERGEWAAVEGPGGGVAEMGVGSEPSWHGS